MIIRILYILFINLVTYGGGGVYIPIYEQYYVDVFHLMNVNDFYNAVSVMNVIPGVMGGKLAGYAMYLEFGYIGMIIGILVFAFSGLLLVLLLDKALSKYREHPIFVEVNKNIKPIIAAILLTITYDFLKMALDNMHASVVIVLGIITIYLLVINKMKIFYIISAYFVIFGFLYTIVL